MNGSEQSAKLQSGYESLRSSTFHICTGFSLMEDYKLYSVRNNLLLASTFCDLKKCQVISEFLCVKSITKAIQMINVQTSLINK